MQIATTIGVFVRHFQVLEVTNMGQIEGGMIAEVLKYANANYSSLMLVFS